MEHRATSAERQGEPASLAHVPAGALSADTAQSSGMTRAEAISARTVGSQVLWMGETRMGPATRSAEHHHGHSETAIHVVSGHPVFVVRDGKGERRIETAPGDYVYVPPWVVHREENPHPGEEAVVVIARSTQEAIVVNVEER
jgi:uncharacterized RmlC-like cupin family protein